MVYVVLIEKVEKDWIVSIDNQTIWSSEDLMDAMQAASEWITGDTARWSE